jgi:hypothetical protein
MWEFPARVDDLCWLSIQTSICIFSGKAVMNSTIVFLIVYVYATIQNMIYLES